MMAKPKRIFSGADMTPSLGIAGAEGLKIDLDNIFRMFDPTSEFPDGSPGGIGTENIQNGAITARKVANKTLTEEKFTDELNSSLIRKGSPVIDPEDRSLTHASIGTTDKSVSAIAGQWFEVVKTEPITLYKKDTIKTPEGDSEYFTLFTQFVQVAVTFDRVIIQGTAAVVPFMFRVVASFTSAPGTDFVLFEETTYSSTQVRSQTIDFSPFEHVQYRADNSMTIKVEARVSSANQVTGRVYSLTVKGNKTEHVIIPVNAF